MMHLINNGEIALALLLLIALVISLSFHEFGHAFVAKLYGDNTAQLAGRLTLNPIAHIDPVGLLMVVFAGIGYAKPVPTNPNNFTSRWGDLMVSAAGPGMNLVLAIVVVNFYELGLQLGWGLLAQRGANFFFEYLTRINLVLMVFNLIPLGPLDGHYILPYFLSRKWAYYYRAYNAQYGLLALLGLLVLSYLGLPVFRFVLSAGSAMRDWIVFV